MNRAIRVALIAALLAPTSAFAAELEFAPTQGGPVIAPIKLETPLTIPTLGELPNLGTIQGVDLNANVLAARNLATASALPVAAAAAASAASAARIQTVAGHSVYTAARTNVKVQAVAANVSDRDALGSAEAIVAPAQAGVSVDGRIGEFYDRSESRGERGDPQTLVDNSSAKQATLSGHSPAPLAKARRAPSLLRRFAPAVATAALMLATPAMALAQGAVTDGPSITAASSLSLLSGIHPLASAAGAVLGAVIGLIVSRPKDGSEPSAGDVLANVLRYGVIGGAGVYALLDLTRMAFVGPSIGLVPLAAAVATAALGRTAFPKKFTDQATTSADRVVGAFPAVAAALGLTVGVTLAPVAMPLQVAAFAMSVTGVATAVYSALFKPGRSPAEGPDNFGKGYVMQALFSGLALALSGWLVYPFAALAVGGFLLTLYTLGKELWSLLPKPPAPRAPKA